MRLCMLIIILINSNSVNYNYDCMRVNCNNIKLLTDRYTAIYASFIANFTLKTYFELTRVPWNGTTI